MKSSTKTKKKSKSISKLKKDLELVFNQFIRLRDKDKPCISCNQFKELQAGHYFAKSGYDGLRFDEMNVNGECSGCNCFDDSHLIGYGENLIEKIGNFEYELLKQRARDYKMHGYKFSRTELEEKIQIYKDKVKSIS